MSFFEPQDIPAGMFKEWWVRRSAKGSRSGSGEESEDEVDDLFEDDIILLGSCNLISAAGTGAGGAFLMHALVQLSIRRWIETRGIQGQYREGFYLFLLSAVQTLEKHTRSRPLAIKLLPHIDRVVKLPTEASNEAALRATLLSEAG